MKSIHQSNLFLLMIMILGIGGSFILGGFSQGVADAIGQYILLFIPAIIYLLITKKDIKKTLRLNPLGFKNMGIIILISIAIQPILMFIASIGGMIFGNQLDFIFDGMQNYSFLLYFFIVAITPAICEELVMRGVILDAYSGVSIKKAALMNGFIFAIFHMNLHQASYTFVMGIVLAYVVYITNSIYASMLIHFINNGLSVIEERFGVGLFSGMDAFMETSNEMVAILVYFCLVLFSVASTLLLMKYLIKINNKDMNEIDISMTGQKIMSWPIAIATIIFLLSSASIWYMSSLGVTG